MADLHYREAAESLLSSVSNPRYRNASQSQSVNVVTEDLVAGHRPEGRMSTVRRFFCLFVTFDILFTSLMWLICVMMRGETLQQIIDNEIIHYNVKTSLFDIIMVAVCRFTVLLLFYALLYINNWSIIALSTGGTCAFLIAKVFVYDVKYRDHEWDRLSCHTRCYDSRTHYAGLIRWKLVIWCPNATCKHVTWRLFLIRGCRWPRAAQPVYQVFLVLTSFTIAWGEAWFLDFRVLPQESQAKHILDAIITQGGATSERTPLLRPSHHHRSGLQSAHGESTVNWFSPVESPETSPRPRRHGEEVILTQEQIDEYKKKAGESVVDAWRVIHLSGWKQEKKGAMRGDVVESLYTEPYGKVYRFTGLVDCPAKFLFQEFKDNITKLPQWNPTILKSELIKQISPDVDLTYQITAGGGRGVVSPRDFVILRRTAALAVDGTDVAPDAAGSEPYAYITSGVSVDVPGYPPNKDLVRGNNKVACWFIKPTTVKLSSGKMDTKTHFQWLMCCDLKGKIPQFVLDTAFSTVMLDYIVHVRKLAADAKAKGVF